MWRATRRAGRLGRSRLRELVGGCAESTSLVCVCMWSRRRVRLGVLYFALLVFATGHCEEDLYSYVCIDGAPMDRLAVHTGH